MRKYLFPLLAVSISLFLALYLRSDAMVSLRLPKEIAAILIIGIISILTLDVPLYLRGLMSVALLSGFFCVPTIANQIYLDQLTWTCMGLCFLNLLTRLNHLREIVIWSGIVIAATSTTWLICNRIGIQPEYYIYPGKMLFINVKNMMGVVTWKYTIIGMMGNPSISAMLLAITAPACLYYRWSLPLFGLAGAGIWIGGSSFALAAYVLSGMTWACIKYRLWINANRRTMLIGTVFLLICGLIVFGHGKLFDTGSGRYLVWTRCTLWWNHLEDILFGGGIGHFKNMYNKIYPAIEGVVFYEAHNEFLETYINMGLLGLGSIFSILYLALKRSFHSDANHVWWASIVSISIMSFGLFPLHISPSNIYIIALLAMCLKKY